MNQQGSCSILIQNQKLIQSAGGVVISLDGKILIVSQGGTSWSLPKGQLEANENTLEAAKREIHEESGISDLELIKELGSYTRYGIALDGGDDKRFVKTIHMFLFRTNQTQLKPIDPENPEALWLDKSEIADKLTHRKDKDFFIKSLSEID